MRTPYSQPEWFERHSEKQYGLSPDEGIRMAYENVIGEAKAALVGYRKKRVKPALTADAVDPVPASSVEPSTREKAFSSSDDSLRLERANWLRAAALPPSSAWAPIETAPKDGTKVLVLDRSMNPDPFVALYSQIPSFAGWWAAGNTQLRPTHWMPLPAPPEAR